MAYFVYKALDQNKQMAKGTISAQSREEAGQSLKKKNLTPLVVKEMVEHRHSKGTVPAIDKITFCRYISTMLSSGLSLSEGVEVLRAESRHPLMRQLLGDISYSLEQGHELSSVFARYPNIFESYFLTLTKAGEVSGTLADIFKYLETELRAEYSLNSKIKGALLYPAIVFSTMIGIGIIMFFFVLPQIAKAFLSLKLKLPAFTNFLFTSSLFLSNNMIPILIGMLVLAILGVLALRKRSIRLYLFRLVKPIPLIRNLIKKIDMARFNRIFSTLLKSAVPITEALQISLSSLSWYEYFELSKTVPNEVTKGKSLSQVIKETKIFPTLMTQMVAAGEKSGTLDQTLADLAVFYEEEVEEELKNLTQVIEPLLMLLVGISVGVMILSIIAPIYGVVGSFSQVGGTGGGAP